ncbi:MAG: hypothetical protein ACI30K_05030 [Muribaculaceae bacterium]
MTREEARNAAADRAYPDAMEGGNIISHSAFVCGAEWADHNPDLSRLWHDASEEPEDGRDMLLLDSEQRVTSTRYHAGYYDVCGLLGWPAYVAMFDAKRWAYVSDLLPKLFENSEQLSEGCNTFPNE